MERDFEYEKNNIGYDCQYANGGIKCKNFEVCEEILPDWWFETKGNYMCVNCDMTGFGELIIKKLDCPICLEHKNCVLLPKCGHSICVECFGRCYYLGYDTSDMPENPYSSMEEEYYEDEDNPKWNVVYPLLEEYQKKLNAWFDLQEEKYSEEEYLRKCSLCRQ
jgi:hypothetical protein